MCGFTFTVFLSAFQLLPTAPYRILALGGSTRSAGLFLGFLTYASALTAPFTGALADRLGKRRVLVVSGLVLTAFAAAYAVITDVRLMLALVILHGFFWSGLLSASSAYVTDIIPSARRAEGISYWGLSTILAIAVAPPFGFFVYERGGWTALCAVAAGLNALMAAIAWGLPEGARDSPPRRFTLKGAVEWRVLALSFTLFLYSYGYGSATSFVALYADANGVTPRTLFFTVFALSIVATRPFLGPLGDRVGHTRVLLPCLGLIVAGLALLAADGGRAGQGLAAAVFGAGFGTAYPMYAAHVIRHVDAARRGAAFGSMLAAFDVGIGTGSVLTGTLVQRHGFRAAYLVAAALSALAVPYFLFVNARTLGRAPDRPVDGAALVEPGPGPA
jgi:MFS family permease